MPPPCRLRPNAGRTSRLRQPQITAANPPAASIDRRSGRLTCTQPASIEYFSAAATPNSSTSMPTFTGTLPPKNHSRTRRMPRSNGEDPCGIVVWKYSLETICGGVLVAPTPASAAGAVCRPPMDAPEESGSSSPATMDGVGGSGPLPTASVCTGAAAGGVWAAAGCGISTDRGGPGSPASGLGATTSCTAAGGVALVPALWIDCSTRTRASTSSRCRPSVRMRPHCQPSSVPAVSPRKAALALPAIAPTTAPASARIQCIAHPKETGGRIARGHEYGASACTRRAFAYPERR